MFSVRLVTADSYQATPLPQLDPTYSEFRGAEIKNVPIVRVFGTTPTGEKTCLHLHGVFPYMYLPYTGEENANVYAYKLAASLDTALNVSLGSTTSNTHHVYQIQRVAGIPYYGYHKREHQFFKVSFYNPSMMKKATDLLQNGSVFNAKLQPHEAHVPYILQFMIDYNLQGMSLINLSNVKYRRVAQLLPETKLSNGSITSLDGAVDYLPSSVVRQSICQLEVDALVSDIQNRQELQRGIELNPGLAAIWEEERARRARAGLPSDSSHLVNPTSPRRAVYQATTSEIYQQQRLRRRLQHISQCDDNTLSTSTDLTPYSIEVNDDDHLIKASNLDVSPENRLDRSQQNLSDVIDMTLLRASKSSEDSRPKNDSSVLDVEDMPLVEMLMELAFDSDNASIDDDSVLGTQLSMYDNGENNSDIEDEDGADLNITCSELNAMSPLDNIEKSSTQLVSANTSIFDTAIPQTSRFYICQQDTNSVKHNSEELQLPQLDGAGDLLNFLDSDEDEHVKTCQESRRVSECETPTLNENSSKSDNMAFIVEDSTSGLSECNKNINSAMASLADDTWPSYTPNEMNLEQFDASNYEPSVSIFEADFDHIMGMGSLLSNKDEASVGINSTFEDNGIPLETVLNGDPCFTQTAEIDKSDFVELQDQYVSLLDSALVPDIHEHLYDSYVPNKYSDRLKENGLFSLNLRALQFTSNSRKCNVSSENVTLNIQERGNKVHKNKLNSPIAFERMNADYRDSRRLAIDSFDHNYNVATWEELQDSKLIPKRILKRKGFGKIHNRVLSSRLTSSNSTLARKRGRIRRDLLNVEGNIVQDNGKHVVDRLSNTLTDEFSLKLGIRTTTSSSYEKSIATIRTSSALRAIERKPQEYSTGEPRSDSLSDNATSRGVHDVSTRISHTENMLTPNLLHKISTSEYVGSVRNTLPVLQYSPYHAGENEDVMQPIVAEFGELVNIPAKDEIPLANDDLKHSSYYSSTRSHSSVIPYGKHNHRHCYYSFMRMGLTQDYVFTSDEIWVIGKRKRGKLRPSSPTVCDRNCRLPFVPLEKLDMVKPMELNMSQLSIREVGPENSNTTFNAHNTVTVSDNNGVDDASISRELSTSSKLPENIDAEDSSRIAKHMEKLIVEKQMNRNIDMRHDDHIDCNEKQLPMNDSASTQSAQISSTQNHDTIARREDGRPVIMRKVYEEKSYEGKVGRRNRSIILTFGDSNNTGFVNSKVRSPKIVAVSISKNNDTNDSENMTEHYIQSDVMMKELNKPGYADAAVIKAIPSSETEKLSKRECGDSIFTSLIMETGMPQSHHEVINTISQDDTKITSNSIINKEFDIISSSQSGSAIRGERPKIWCSIDREKVDLTFVTAMNNVKNIVNTSEFFGGDYRTSSVCSELIPSQNSEDHNDATLISTNDIVTNSYLQRFDEYDTNFDVHSCDLICKDDITTINIFETTESIGEHTPSLDNCESSHESEQYTIAVAEADFYARKNYRIDAISLEIPQYLFEEDSNSEISQKQSPHLSNAVALKAPSIEKFSMFTTPSNTCGSINIQAFNLSKTHENNGDIFSTIDNSSCSYPAEIDQFINGNESSHDSSYSCILSRSSTPEKLYCPPSCHDGSNRNLEEEMIARMMNSIFVLRGYNKTSITNDAIHADHSFANETEINYCYNNDAIGNPSNDDSRQESVIPYKSIDGKNVESVVKYSPDKISITRKIHPSRNKIVDKTFDNPNTSMPKDATSSVEENEFSNNRTCWDSEKIIIENRHEGKLSDIVVSAASENFVNIQTPITHDCFSSTKNIETQNNKNNSILNTQFHLHDNADMGSLSLVTLHESVPIDRFIYESDDHQVIHHFEALTVKDEKLSMESDRGQNSREERIMDGAKDINSNLQDNSALNPLDDISETVLPTYDDDHGNTLHLVKLSAADQFRKNDANIQAVADPMNSSDDKDVNVNEEKIENSQWDKSSGLLETKDFRVESSMLEFRNEINMETHGMHIENNYHENRTSESNDVSKSPVEPSGCDNHTSSVAVSREVSIVLERLHVNDLNKYPKSNRNVETGDTNVSMGMTHEEAKGAEQKFTTQKKCVKFNEEVLIFGSDVCTSLIDAGDQTVGEDNRMELLLDDDNVSQVIEIFDEDESMLQDPSNFLSNGGDDDDDDDDYDDDDDDDDDVEDDDDDGVEGEVNNAKQMSSTSIARLRKNKNSRNIDTGVIWIDLINGYLLQANEVSMGDVASKFKSREIDLCAKENEKLLMDIDEATLKPKKTKISKYEEKKYCSGILINQKERGQIEKFERGSRPIEKECAISLKRGDESANKHYTSCVRTKQSAAPSIQVKNDTLVDHLDGILDSTMHENLSTVIERKTTDMAYSNLTAVMTGNDLNNCRSESRYKTEGNGIPTRKTQPNICNYAMDAVSTISNVYECSLNGDRILRSYRTSSGYRNKVHTVSIDQKMVFTKVTISDQQLWKKSPKERFLAHIGLCSLKPRGFGWLPEHTMTGHIQLKQPHVVIQRLASDILKYYGYTRRFKSNKFGKRFKASANQFMIPAYDGPADLSSSESEPDPDSSKSDSERRVCVYQSSKRKIKSEVIASTKKRKQTYSDDDEEINKRKHTKRCTPQQSNGTLKMNYRSPHWNTLKSPSVSGDYSPLEILHTSPRVRKYAPNYLDEPRISMSHVAANINTLCISPRRRMQLMRENFPRNRIEAYSADGQGHVRKLETNIDHRQMGELNILDSHITGPAIQSPAACASDESLSRDVSPNAIDAQTVRKNLIFITGNNSPVGLSPSQLNSGAPEWGCSVEGKTLSTNSRIVKLRTSGYVDLHANNIVSHLEDSGNNHTTVFEQNNGKLYLKHSLSIHSEQLDNHNMYKSSNVTSTQYLSLQERMQQPLSFSNRRQIPSEFEKLRSVLPKLNPPTIKRVIDTMETYNIPKFRNSLPFFSDQADIPVQKGIVHKMLNVVSKGMIELSDFKSTMQSITGINRWRKMKINEFHLACGVFESKSIRQNLAAHASIIMTPLLPAPIPKNVLKWIRVRGRSKTIQEREEGAAAPQIERKTKEKCIEDVKMMLRNEYSSTWSSSFVEGSPEISSEKLRGRTANVRNEDESKFRALSSVQHIADLNTIMPESGVIAPSFESILAKSALIKKTLQSKQVGITCGQIECLTKTVKSNMEDENVQNCKILTRYQFITVFCVEVHVTTRHDLLPNPQCDPISALFYAIQSDVPPSSAIQPLEHGVITTCSQGDSNSVHCCGSKVPFAINFVADEKELFQKFIEVVNCSDAEILIGWEIESLSWGYIFQRALRLGINLINNISRVPGSQCKLDNQMPDNLKSLVDMKLPGRIILDIWRIMRSEIVLMTYTFENVMYHVMNERLPCPSFKSLTTWWESTQSRWKVVQHYSTMTLGILRILEQLDIIGKTSEYARLFGIQFHEVFTRGSQYRVESLMLRLAKPLNYVAVSPSPQQRSSMKAMEALPLIMEPESKFYSDPVIVLDFQSLYPSIIIAHNYCYSTCLGRVEHIGQPGPFEFGASVLRVSKKTALKVEEKVNYAPCGVAFVKSEVRCGILPRMLTEILNTRLMVKNAMKDHSKNDRLLQRVLHARQKGLKDLANVTYGYTAANFTGRMPCVEVGDSVVSKAKETLERAIKVVESTTKWGARVIYGDTDSLFVLVPGKSKDDAFNIGNEIADAVTASNLSPIKLKFEKVLYPAILQTKKRYCGYMYETPDQNEPEYLAKGIETVRRDGCPAVSKILEKSLRILFDTKDVSLVKQYVRKQLEKVLSGKVSLEDLTFAKEFRGLQAYKERACVPALELTRRLMKKDPRALPRRGERVRYVIVSGAPNQALIQCVRSPWELIYDAGLRPNGPYYVTRVIIPPLNRCLNLMGVDVNMWYREMSHRQILRNPVAIPEHKQKRTISQYFGTVVCVSCGQTSHSGICNECSAHPTDTLIMLHEKLRWLERMNDHVTMICQSCVGRGCIVDCVSLDCPVLYRRVRTQRDSAYGIECRRIIQEGGKLDF